MTLGMGDNSCDGGGGNPDDRSDPENALRAVEELFPLLVEVLRTLDGSAG